MKYDVDAIKNAASGRWEDILSTVCGVTCDVLDGRHHACPKCGGTDRFRWDRQAGFAICNQCFRENNGDGFAAIQWLLDCDFPAAIAKVAEYLGIKPKKARGADPEKDLEFLEWSSNLVPYFAANRHGITEEALLAFGARRARYKRQLNVFAIPVIGDGLNVDQPAGWVLMDAMGGSLPKWDRSGNEVGRVKTKLVYGSKPGLVNTHAIKRLATEGLVETIWKVEGITDALTLWSAIPASKRDRHVVVTNANGAGEQPKWMASMLARAKPMILHDADKPGEVGAKLWAKAITGHGVQTTIVRLPYEVSETHGKDLRDYLNSGRDYDDLLELARTGDVCRPVGEGEESEDGNELPLEELILNKLCLEVLYETETGHVRIFSTRLRKSSTFKQVDRIKRENILQACGPVARNVISDDPDNQNTFSMKAIREAVATVSSLRRGKSDDRGIGVWQGIDKDGNRANSLVVANNDEAARWNGERMLKRVLHPRVSGLVVDFGHEPDNWFDFDRLASYTARAEESSDWREQSVMQAVDLFKRWRWSGPYDAELVTGLVMATWIQTVWTWRPLVAVIGESNSGKSTLFNALGGEAEGHGMFGGLALSSSKSSEAGIRQGVGNTGRIILLDEFEKSNERQKILETFRASSRGDTVMRGTATQRGLQFRLRHIAWVSAIESGLNQQPDRNRFVMLELLEAEKEKRGKLTLPSGPELVDLGLRLLACSIVCGLDAAMLAADLKSVRVEGASNRVVETYAVPAAILASAIGHDRKQTEGLLEDLMAGVLANDDEPDEKDQERLVNDILGATIRCDHGVQRSVAQMLESYRSHGSVYNENYLHLERHGITFKPIGICIHHATVSQMLLKGTDWEGKQVRELLRRYVCPDSKVPAEASKPVKFSGLTKRCIVIPFPRATETAE